MSMLRVRGMFAFHPLEGRSRGGPTDDSRGIVRRGRRLPECVLAAALAVMIAPWARADADLLTYDHGDGQTYYALSLTPPDNEASAGPCDVVILFDTSASQAGVYRETALAALEACLAKLRAGDRVQLLAVDLEARPLSDTFLAVGSAELRAAVDTLRQEPPLGSTDMEVALRAAAKRFESGDAAVRAVLYIGDGLSTVNLLGTESFRSLVEQLRAGRIPVSSYAIGPRRDGVLLAALANQTGGNLYVDDAMVFADENEGISGERATQENLRRGALVGDLLAKWAGATVSWVAEVALPAELGEVFPEPFPPLRSDRDTVVVGATGQRLAAPLTVRMRVQTSGAVADLHWTAEPKSDDSYAYLAQVVETARNDGGLTLPTIGLAGLAETGRIVEDGLEGMTDLAQRAIAIGDAAAADQMSQAVLRRDPGNVRAQTVQRMVRQGGAAIASPAATASAGDDLNLVRTAQVPPGAAEPALEFPAEGALTDRFEESGELLDLVEQQKRVFAQMLRREVENTIIDARRGMSIDPEAASQQLKLALQNVERAPELSPEVRAQLIDRLRTALREVQRTAAIKDELDAAREEQLAAARERQLLNERLARGQERERQLLGRFNALVDERRYDEALDVAIVVEELDPEGVAPRAAYVGGQLRRNDYLSQVARTARWRNFFDSLYTVELSSVGFPDDPPIVYPAAPVWEELTNRRKKFASVDLKASGGAEERINEALRSPLKATGIEFLDMPLEEVVVALQDEYDIPIHLNTPALEDAGLSADEPVSLSLQNVTLRSALRLMLRPMQLTYIIEDEVLIITTPEDAESSLVAKVYPVADLVLPIEIPQIGGGGGGLGGGQQGGGGGGLGGGGGGFGGGGGGFGGGGGGGGLGGGGGGGLFSVPDDATSEQAKSADLTLSRAKPADARSDARQADATPAAIAIDESLSADVFWNGYFAERREPAAVRQAVRELMGEKKFNHVIALIQSALRQGQPQPWMYESLGIALELAGRSQTEIERAVMSAADFSTTPDELMYIAAYLSRSGLDRRALQLCQQVAKLEPLRREAYALGLRSAQRAGDLDGIQWATVGILGQAWTKAEEAIQTRATHVAQDTLARLEREGREEELERYRGQLDAAVARDCVVRVSWTGNADVDIEVEEPTGTICSLSEPRTTSGGVNMGDAYAAEGNSSSPVMTETYVCPQGFAGTYRVRIRRVWGEVAAGKVTVDVYRNFGTDRVEHQRRQLDLGEKDAMVVFDLDAGRRTEPLEAAQLAGAVQRQEQVSRAVLAQQLDSLSDERVLPNSDILRRRRALGALGLGGAVGFQPIIEVLPEGTMMGVTGVVSADRRYVRISVAPIFSTIGDVQTFTFAGAAEEADGGNGNGIGN